MGVANSSFQWRQPTGAGSNGVTPVSLQQFISWKRCCPLDVPIATSGNAATERWRHIGHWFHELKSKTEFRAKIDWCLFCKIVDEYGSKTKRLDECDDNKSFTQWKINYKTLMLFYYQSQFSPIFRTLALLSWIKNHIHPIYLIFCNQS